MGLCCSVSNKKSQKQDAKTFITMLSDTTSLVDVCIDKIATNIKRYEIIEALAIFLNGLYSYLLKTQATILEKESEVPEGFDDDPLLQLKLAIEKLKEDLIAQDFLFDPEAKKKTMKKILNVELSLKLLLTQLEKINPIENHPYLIGDFQNGFESLLSKTIISPNYLNDEILEIKKAIATKPAFTCKQCNKDMHLVKGTADSNETFVCSICEHCLYLSADYWACDACNIKACLLCNSFGTKANCVTCKSDLKFTKDLTGIKGYESKLVRCDHCGADYKWEEGTHHCYYGDHGFDYCIKCRTKMRPELVVKIIIENQRFWKNQWTDCPLTAGERGKKINESGENIVLELEENEEDYAWGEDWHLFKGKNDDPDNWEYSVTWGNSFSDDSKGCFVRRKVFVRRSEKIVF